jgi:hypothetical protein
MPRFRFTIRTFMLVVAVAGIVLGGATLKFRRDACLKKSVSLAAEHNTLTKLVVLYDSFIESNTVMAGLLRTQSLNYYNTSRMSRELELAENKPAIEGEMPSADYEEKARQHENQARQHEETARLTQAKVKLSRSQLQRCDQEKRRYDRAARRPWLLVPPGTPEPK